MNKISHLTLCLASLCIGVCAHATTPVPPSSSWKASGYFRIHPDFKALTAVPTGKSPTQIRHAYGFDQLTATGAGQKIVIIDAYGSPTLQADLNAFNTYYGLPATTVTVAYATGKPTANDSGWALETALDVEWAHAIAPGAAIILVVAKSSSFTDLIAAVNYANTLGAKQVSMSWGGNEFPSETGYDSIFLPSITYTASSGDSGAGVIWPAASPNVVAVGGTTLNTDAAGNVLSQSAWSGSGGGVSAYESVPTFQSGWIPSGSTKRGVPDVAYDADPTTGVSVNYNGGWMTIGGTSIGAPQWAGLSALFNSGRPPSAANTNALLYSLATKSYSTYYSDVVNGNDGGNSAGAGYDYVTGLGSPKAAGIVAALTSGTVTPTPPPTVPTSPLASPANFTASISGTSVTLKWAGVTGATGYTVASWLPNGNNPVFIYTDVTGASCTLTVPSGSIIFQVQAIASVPSLDSKWSAPLQLNTGH